MRNILCIIIISVLFTGFAFAQPASRAVKRGNKLYKQEKFDEALKYLEQALSIRKQLLDEKHPGIAICYFETGNVYLEQKKHQKALEYYDKTLALLNESKNPKQTYIMAIYHNMGRIHSETGNYDDALNCYEKSLATRKDVLGETHPDYAHTLLGVAKVYYQQKN